MNDWESMSLCKKFERKWQQMWKMQAYVDTVALINDKQLNNDPKKAQIFETNKE